MNIRYATENDIESINRIARQYPKQLTWVSKNKLQRGVDERSLLVACIDTVVTGFVLYHACRDGWQTIYDMAVHRDYERLGIGQRLLYSVPCPMRLKCTADNVNANAFYKKSGMEFKGTIEGNKRKLNVYELPILHILHKGGATQYPRYAKLLGYAYGSRSSDKAYALPFMVDIDYMNPNWDKHMDYVRRYRPVMAMVVDYMSPDNRAELHCQIADLREAGVLRIMVCPKFHGAIADIPEDCLIAISVPTEHGAFMPHANELVGRSLHLLGGHPDQHANLIYKQYPQSRIISIDSSNVAVKATRGQFWSPVTLNWKTAPKGRFSDETLMKYSKGTINQYLAIAPSVYNLPRSKRLERCYYRGDLFSA